MKNKILKPISANFNLERGVWIENGHLGIWQDHGVPFWLHGINKCYNVICVIKIEDTNESNEVNMPNGIAYNVQCT